MGIGTNVQDRAIALHHLDAPWRPADVAQREGRILRQGNLNPEVQVLRYTTAQSFDGYMWQTLERKARFIGQVMHGRLDGREIDDIGDTALSFSEVKALATGNPLLMEKAEADAVLARLQRAERAHYRNQEALEYAIDRHQADIKSLTLRAADFDVAIARRQDTRGDAFTMTVGGHQHSKRPEAGRHLKDILEQEIAGLDGQRARVLHPGQLGGFPVVASIDRALGQTSITLILDGAPGATVQQSADDLRAADPVGLVTRLENRLHRLEEHKQETLADTERARRELAHATEAFDQPFAQTAQLKAARERAQHIDGQLQQMAAPQSDPIERESEVSAGSSDQPDGKYPRGCGEPVAHRRDETARSLGYNSDPQTGRSSRPGRPSRSLPHDARIHDVRASSRDLDHEAGD